MLKWEQKNINIAPTASPAHELCLNKAAHAFGAT